MSDPTFASGAVSAAYVQTATGIVLLAMPFWADVLHTVNTVAATVASVCGAIVGLVGVWRIIRLMRGQP